MNAIRPPTQPLDHRSVVAMPGNVLKLVIAQPDENTTRTIFEFLAGIGREVLRHTPNAKTHDATVFINEVPIDMEMQFQDGALTDIIPSHGDDNASGRVHKHLGKRDHTLFEKFVKRMEVLYWFVSGRIAWMSRESKKRTGDIQELHLS